MNRIKVLKDPKSYNSETDYVAHLPVIQSKEELLKQLSIKLQFPDYFGFNWDALSDCLRDFDWIKQKGIILVHDESPKLEEQVLMTYLEILVDAVQDWKDGEKHFFQVIFPEQFESELHKYISVK